MKSIGLKVYRMGQKGARPTSKRHTTVHEQTPHGCVSLKISLPLDVITKIKDDFPEDSVGKATKKIVLAHYGMFNL